MCIPVSLEYLTVEHCSSDRQSLKFSAGLCCCSQHHGRPPDIDPEMLVRKLKLEICSVWLDPEAKESVLLCVWANPAAF